MTKISRLLAIAGFAGALLTGTAFAQSTSSGAMGSMKSDKAMASGDHMKSGHMKSDHMKSDHMKSDHMKSDHMKSDHMKSGHMSHMKKDGNMKGHHMTSGMTTGH